MSKFLRKALISRKTILHYLTISLIFSLAVPLSAARAEQLTASWVKETLTTGFSTTVTGTGALNLLHSGTLVATSGARSISNSNTWLTTFNQTHDDLCPELSSSVCQATSNSNGQVIYVRLENGSMFVSKNSGASWTLLPLFYGRGVAEIETIATSQDGSAVAVTSYIDNEGWHIFFSNDFGISVSNLSADLSEQYPDFFENWKVLLLTNNHELFAANADGGGNYAYIYKASITRAQVKVSTSVDNPLAQIASIPSGITSAAIPSTASIPATTLNFGGLVPTSVTVSPVASNPAAPSSTPFKILGSTKIVDIQITGSFNGSATVCLDGSANDHLYHYTGGQWVELPSRSYANGQVCGVTTSFSPFAAAEPAPVNASPDAPASVVATATGKRTVTVAFTAPSSNGGSVVTSYTATSTPGGITKTLTQAGGGTFNFDGLQPGTSYTFAVTAKNANGTSAAATSNSVKTTAADVASLTSITFTDDGSGTAGKLVWVGKNIDAVLYTGPAGSYPGPFTFGAFTSSWNGSIRNLTPATEYTVSIYAVSADGIGESKSLTFKTGAKTDLVKNLAYWNTWLTANTYSNGEAARLFGLLTKFNSLETSPIRSFIKVPVSLASTVSATSLTPKSCSVVSTTAKVDAGMVKALTKETCTISYTVSGPSNAPATLVKDFVFKKVG